ncbi:MAG: protein kinase, partial [Rubrobacter sp.]|nr:protein kinase [Rubrobacter sp.]
MPLQGSLDNRYEVKTSLGRGGMAEVYLARDRVLDRDVALKILSRCYAEDEDFVRRFRREAQSAASLAHPNVVSIHDLGEVEGQAGEPPTYYIAMEYVEGISLRELLEREVRLPYETAVSIARQVAEGLSAAHERGIVHRDIKPHNILLSGNAGGEYPGEGRGGVKVADFGIARAASSTTTNTEGILGTAYYLSPEQAMGGEATYQSDLYSLGVVLYEMLTGRRPYDAESPFGVAMRHVTGDLRPPKQIVPDLPAELNSVVVRLLGKDPEERPGDAEELLANLEDLPQSSEAREAKTLAPEAREASSGGKSRQRGAGLLVPICALIMLTVSLWGVQQGFVGSSLTGFNPGEFRDDVGRILGGGDGNDAPQSGGAQPDPAAGPTGGATTGEDSNRERARDKTQEETEATGESREDSSGADSADGEE